MYIPNNVIKILITLLFIVLNGISVATAHEAITPVDQLPIEYSANQREWLEQHPVIQIGAMNDWPPLNFINFNGEADGFGVELITLLNQRLGGRLRLISGEWPKLYQSVLDKQLDALLDLTPKAAREPFFNFTRPYLNIPHVIIGRDTPPFYLNESELTGKKIALEKGFGNVSYYKQHYPDIEILEYNNTSEALGAVAQGEADAYIGNRAVADYIIRNELIGSLKTHARASKDGSILAFGVRKDWPVLAEILQLALNSISTQEFYALLDDVVNKISTVDDHSIQLSEGEKQWLADHPIIRLASDANRAPLEYFDEYGEYQGIAADFIKLIENKLNIQFVPSPSESRAELNKKIKQRQLDVLSLAMSTPSRREYMNFTQPYVSNTMVIVTQDNVEFVPGISGLMGKVVAVGDGYASQELLSSEHPEIILQTYTTGEQALASVVRGEAFAYIGNIATISYLIQGRGLSNLRVSGEIPYRFELAMGIRNDWPELTSILNKAVDSISAHEKAAIFSRWVHVKTEDPIPWNLLISLFSALSAVVIVTLYWNYLLNRKVKQRTELLEHRTLHDELTSLPNRTALKSQLEQRVLLASRAKNTNFAVLFIDLDDFKKVNDTLGHSIGDQLLISVTQRLQSLLQPADFISRFGGDEFVIVSEYTQSRENIEALCAHLLQGIKDTYRLSDLTINMSMSIGIACYPEDGNSVDELIRNADTAMYAAKKHGRNAFHFFSEKMNEHMYHRIQLEEQMLTAIENQEIYSVFQPIVNLQSGEVIKFEVLSRWHNPKFGMIPPDEFIPLAEHNGFILTIGETVLINGLSACARLRDKFNKDYAVTINVSPRQFNDPGFVQKVSELLERFQLPPEALVLEITEGVLIEHSAEAEQAISQLVGKGIQLAMDDFGKGYSSLSYVRNYPFDILKIDKEFIQDIEQDNSSRQLVSSVLAMADSLTIDVIAEGVETRQQVEKLLEMGCVKAQGYYYSRPLKEPELITWLNERECNN